MTIIKEITVYNSTHIKPSFISVIFLVTKLNSKKNVPNVIKGIIYVLLNFIPPIIELKIVSKGNTINRSKNIISNKGILNLLPNSDNSTMRIK